MSDLSNFHCSVIAGAGHGGSSMTEAATPPPGFHNNQMAALYMYNDNKDIVFSVFQCQEFTENGAQKTPGAKNVLLMRGYIGIGRLVKPNRKTNVKITAQCTGGTQKGFSEGIS